MTAHRLSSLLVLTWSLAGCAREPASLIDHGSWEDVSDGDHPFADRAPPESERECADLAVFPELLGAEQTISIDLSECNYVTLTQLTATDMRPAEIITLRLWRDAALFSTEQDMEIAVQVGDAFLFDQAFPAPGDSDLVYEQVEVTEALPEGLPVYVFVNSHRDLGARHDGDSLNLIELSRSDPRWEEER